MRIDIALTHHPTKIFQQHCHSSSNGYKLVATTLTSYKKRFFIYLHAQLHTNNIAIPYLIPASSPCLKSLHCPTLKFSLPPKNPNQYPSFTKQFTTLYSNISNFLTYFHIRPTFITFNFSKNFFKIVIIQYFATSTQSLFDAFYVTLR